MKRQMTSSEPVEGVFVRRAAVSWTLCDCENLVPAEWGDERLAHPGARSTEMPIYTENAVSPLLLRAEAN